MSDMSDFVERVAQEFNLLLSKYEPKTIDFSESVPFNRTYSVMEALTITEAVAFTPNETNLFLGGVTFLKVVADGVNVPTFVGFAVTGAYVNEEGAVNFLLFSYLASGTFALNISGGTVEEAEELEFTLLDMTEDLPDYVAGTSAPHRGISVQSAVGDCSIKMDIDTALSLNAVFGLKESGVNGAYTTINFAALANSGGNYWANLIFANGVQSTGVTNTNGDEIKISRTIADGVVKAQYKRGGVYTDLGTYDTTSFVPLFIAFDMLNDSTKILNLVTEGFV